MFRIRFHGRGGQGMKTASRILGSAFFMEGFEVQDAPRYGAERRGAPVFASVRASREPVHERGVIRRPDLVVVADQTLLALPAAGVMAGIDEKTVLLIRSSEKPQFWKERIGFEGELITVSHSDLDDGEGGQTHNFSSVMAGAAAGLTGVVGRESLGQALWSELASLGDHIAENSREMGLRAYDLMQDHAGVVREGGETDMEETLPPEWVTLESIPAKESIPAIYAGGTSEKMLTGLWRTMRPEIDYARCAKCWWNCSVLCPDSGIHLNEEGYPVIDYRYCKGCLICVAQCPRHAIRILPEESADKKKGGGS